MTHAVDRVIGVHQENTIVRHRPRVRLKCFGFGFEEHDPAMRLRAAHRNSKSLAGLQIRGPCTASDESCTGRAQTAVNTLGATQAKFDYRITLGGEANARCFRRDEALEIQNREQSRFQQLTLDDGATNTNQRLIWKDQCSLRYRVDVTSGSQTTHVIKKTGIEQRLAVVPVQRGKVIYFCILKTKRAHEIDCRRESACDRKRATKRVLTERDMERSFVTFHTSFPITACHRDFVEVAR